jgi:hypothetical protein
MSLYLLMRRSHQGSGDSIPADGLTFNGEQITFNGEPVIASPSTY